MATDSRHIIRSNQIELQYHGATDAMKLQHSFHEWYEDQLLPALDTALDKYADERYRRIDRIEVSVDVNSVNLDDVLVQQVIAAVHKQLSELQGQDRGITNDDLQAPSHHIFSQFLFYLKEGYLPWNSSMHNSRELVSKLFDESFAANDAHRRELSLLVKEPAALRRLMAELNDSLFLSLLKCFTMPGPENAQRLILFMQQVRIANQARQQHRLKEDHNQQRQFSLRTRQLLLEYVLRQRDTDLQQLLLEIVSMNDSGIFTEHAIRSAAGIFPGFDLSASKRLVDPDSIKKSDTQVIRNNQAPSDDIYIANAGIVLVAPFLERFFNNVGIASDGKLNSDALAVSITQWMVSGDPDFSESELVLPKILCGIMPAEQVEIVRDIPAQFTQEAEEMLRAVIAHWSVLKDSGIDALRQNFLQRAGRLSFHDNKWILVVEKGPFDMLLLNLPWSFQYIRMPWMNWLLQTQWQD